MSPRLQLLLVLLLQLLQRMPVETVRLSEFPKCFFSHFFQRDSTFSFLRYRLVGKSSATCVLSGTDVSWDTSPYCESKQMSNVLCSWLPQSSSSLSGSLGDGRRVFSSWHPTSNETDW